MNSPPARQRRDGPISFYGHDSDQNSMYPDDGEEENADFYGDDADDDDLNEGSPPPPSYYPGINTCIVSI